MPRRPKPSSERERKSEREPRPHPAPAGDTRTRIVEALMELAAERRWEEISISDVARHAGVTLAEFREHFASKAAVLGAFARCIDKIVLEGTSDDLAEEPAKDRLFDVLMRRLDAMAPYKRAIEGMLEWVNREPIAAVALNRQVVNSMRFMLEAADIGSEGPVGMLKLQGLVLTWRRILRHWLRDDDPGLARTMAVLDRELARGGRIVARAEDIRRLTSPLRSLARAVCRRRSRRFERIRERWRGDDREPDETAEASV